jgi:glutamyl/glutaminyl-tRNA synthetase
VHDDALQGVTHVIRGEDLRASTHIHVLLQKLLGLPRRSIGITPCWSGQTASVTPSAIVR